MKKLKNTAAAFTAAVTSAVISVAANAEGGLAASKAVTGTKALLNDISNILLVVAPLVGTACIVYFAVRHGAAEEMDQKKGKQRMIVAAVRELRNSGGRGIRIPDGSAAFRDSSGGSRAASGGIPRALHMRRGGEGELRCC